MRAALQGVVLLGYGGLLVRVASGPQLARYVRPGTWPLVVAAATVLVVTGGTAAVGHGRRTRTAGHAAGSRAGWLPAVPLLVLGVIAPPALGLSAAQRPAAVPRSSRPFPALHGPEPVHLGLVDVVLRTVWDHGRSLRGHRLAVDGFVLRNRPGGFVLTRLVITCCAADAQPYDLDVRTDLAVPDRGSWVRVTGRFVGVDGADRAVAQLAGLRVSPIEQPADPYE